MTKRTISMMATMTTVALLSACGDGGGSGGTGGNGSSTTTGSPTTTTTTTGTGGSGGAGGAGGASHPLEEGDYEGMTTSVTGDTCNGSVTLNAGVETLTWTSATALTLDDGAGQIIPCTLAAGAATCMTVVSPDQVDANTTVTLSFSFADGSLVIMSPTSFDLTTEVAVDCQGSGCAALAAKAGTTYPCGVTGAFSFSHL